MARALHVSIVTSLLSLWLAPAAQAKDIERPYEVTEKREHCADYDATRRPFFGDTHVHTTLSFDARAQDTRITPREAYLFAKGQEVGLQPFTPEGKPLRSASLDRPLDFTALSDHAAMLGEVRICTTPGLPGNASDICWGYNNIPGVGLMLMATRNIIARQRYNFCGEDGEICLGTARSVWQEIQDAAEEAYDRSSACSFTSFVGYEWTASVGQGSNLHRNVIFRNASVPDLPISWVETPSAASLWEHLQRDCIEGVEGCDALTIPHNSNLSSGLMFAAGALEGPQDIDEPETRDGAERRARWEPLVEIMQHKGDSECLIAGDTTDEACGFEKLPYNSFAGVRGISVLGDGGSLKPTRKGMVREALKRGLVQAETLGVNGLKFGIVASTDTHLGTPGLTDETESMGHGGAGQGAAFGVAPGLPDNVEFNPGGLAVVWAEENTRDALFSAMMRKETYGTSGPRHIVRFFGGWNYDDAMCDASDFADRGYAGGVPMGGNLAAGSDAAPTFAVSALQDAGTDAAHGTPLQRVQIVKGWLDGEQTHEQVYDVAGGENGASVDTATCETQGEGAESLCSVWRDPDFDPKQRAFYYARVLENPTCRWSQHICVAKGVDCSKPETIGPGLQGCCAADHQPTVQERSWTSPIWYAPSGS